MYHANWPSLTSFKAIKECFDVPSDEVVACVKRYHKPLIEYVIKNYQELITTPSDLTIYFLHAIYIFTSVLMENVVFFSEKWCYRDFVDISLSSSSSNRIHVITDRKLSSID